MSSLHSVERLREHARAEKSGEFIFATQSVEIHVFLQRGKVAWATDSSHPFEFARFLKTRCNIDDEAFAEVLETCRTSRLPLGQTLVEWGLATWDDVRDSLRHQLGLALSSLSRSAPGDMLFLERRQFATYDERLTFDLDDIEREPEVASREGSPAPGVVAEDPTSSAEAVLSALRGASWVVMERDGAREEATRDSVVALPPALEELTLADGADFVALRSPDRCVIGATSRREGERVWAGLPSDSGFRTAVATLASLGLVRAALRPSGRATSDPITWSVTGRDDAWEAELTQVFAYSRDVLAAALTTRRDGLVSGMGRSGTNRRDVEALVARRARVFSPGRLEERDELGELESLGFRYRMLASGERDVWCFGAETLDGAIASSVWILVAREASQGVGWACLTALLRTARGGKERAR